MRDAIVITHVLGALIFLVAHAVSMYVSFRVRGERDPVRAARLLGRSAQSIGPMYIGLAALLLAGIAGGFVGGFWTDVWLWASIGILVVVLGVMYSVAAPFYMRIRQAVGEDGAVTADDLERLSTSTRPFILAAVGGIGFVAIVWLMVAKPF